MMSTPQHQEPLASEALALSFGLSSTEWAQILTRLGRTPTLTEAGIFSALWSEHCSYKSSKVHLRGLPSTGPHVVQGPGENAGAIALGGGLVAVFKIESHNHPSFIEPHQGAATGVGGILRDIFTMGARPIALMNSLRLGALDHPKTPHLLRGVVKGIGSYGNAVGIPTVAGELYFDACYNGNILVNAFALGICQEHQLLRATAQGVGNLIVYLGAKTGRDGIHGATMASAEFSESSEDKRPTVQVGDPFKEKLLLEACMALSEAQCLIGIQDMGAAGLTSSSAEMAARGGVGLRLDMQRVPMREAGMTPYELMLSESQERMLLCVAPPQLAQVAAIADKWGIDHAVIGEVIAEQALLITWGEQCVAHLPIAALSEEAPLYHKPTEAQPEPRPLPTRPDTDWHEVTATLPALLAAPNLCSRRWVYRQYDQEVGLGTVRRPGQCDAGVVRLASWVPGRQDALAMTVDCNARAVKADPYQGTVRAMCEAYRNLSVSGARPLALSDCLNFGSPDDPQIMWQLAQSCAGMAHAARLLETPVISGNVSLYNQTVLKGQTVLKSQTSHTEDIALAIAPTPTIAMVGHMANAAHAGTYAVTQPDLEVWCVREGAPSLAQSEYLFLKQGEYCGPIEAPDVLAHKKVSDYVRTLWEQGLLHAAHDAAEGGLLVALAECLIAGEGAAGMTLDLSPLLSPAASQTGEPRLDEALFGEGESTLILILSPAQSAAVKALAHSQNLQNRLHYLGTTTKTPTLTLTQGPSWTYQTLKTAHESTLQSL